MDKQILNISRGILFFLFALVQYFLFSFRTLTLKKKELIAKSW